MAIHPDGTRPELIYGNNTNNCYMNAHEVPDTKEVCCTLVSHGGDHNGPIGLVDLTKAPSDPSAITNITPDVTPQYDMNWIRVECFRDPIPVARDYFLVSHSPADRFGLYIIDRYGNRELLYLDPEIGSMSPRPLQTAAAPRAGRRRATSRPMLGQFTVADVFEGLAPTIPRGKVKYLRVCQEVRAELEELTNGEFRSDHNRFRISTPRDPPGQRTAGLAQLCRQSVTRDRAVEADGSASFYAPAGKVLYFQASMKTSTICNGCTASSNCNPVNNAAASVATRAGNLHRRSIPRSRPSARTAASRSSPGVPAPSLTNRSCSRCATRNA